MKINQLISSGQSMYSKNFPLEPPNKSDDHKTWPTYSTRALVLFLALLNINFNSYEYFGPSNTKTSWWVKFGDLAGQDIIPLVQMSRPEKSFHNYKKWFVLQVFNFDYIYMYSRDVWFVQFRRTGSNQIYGWDDPVQKTRSIDPMVLFSSLAQIESCTICAWFKDP